MRDPLAMLILVGPSRLGLLRHLGLCGLGSGVTNAPLLSLSKDEGRKTKLARPPVRRLVISFFFFLFPAVFGRSGCASRPELHLALGSSKRGD